jgi:sulfopyruvate decarboxylase TPP-binding subunit
VADAQENSLKIDQNLPARPSWRARLGLTGAAVLVAMACGIAFWGTCFAVGLSGTMVGGPDLGIFLGVTAGLIAIPFAGVASKNYIWRTPYFRIRQMFSGEQIVTELDRIGVTHVVWLPDSTLGAWEQSLQSSPNQRLIRVCREGEAWAVAAGLYLGGARPLVMIQCTGLFDSLDSLRNAVYDYQLPLFAVIGYRSYLNTRAVDSARSLTEPTLRAWAIDYRLIDSPEKLPRLAAQYQACQKARMPGAVLIAEGRM